MAMNTKNQEAPGRQEIEALLPWHAAGTLSRRDSERVERALAADQELARRFAMVREEQQETIHLNESLGAPSARAMEKLFAAIDAECVKAPARRSFDLAGRISEFLASFAPRTVAYAAAAAVVVLFVQSAVLTSVVLTDQTELGPNLMSYRDATSPQAVLRFTPQVTADEITRFLDAHNATVIDGPKRGLYTVRLSTAILPEAEVTRIVQRMQAETKIVEFIATKE
jgi:anti-sigma-K factor RskA